MARFARNCARCARAIMLSVRQYRRFYQTNLRSEFYRSATIRSTTFSSHYFRTEVTPRFSSLSEPTSKREPPRFAPRLTKQLCASRAIARTACVQSCCQASSTVVLTQQTFGLLWYRPLKCKGRSEIIKTRKMARFARNCVHCERAIMLPS